MQKEQVTACSRLWPDGLMAAGQDVGGRCPQQQPDPGEHLQG